MPPSCCSGVENGSSGLPLYSTGRNIARYLCDYIYNRPIVNRENPDLMPQKVAIARRGGWLGEAFIPVFDT